MKSVARRNLALGIPVDYPGKRGWGRQREAVRLILVGRNEDGRPVRLTPAAASAWKRMQIAAKVDGIALLPISGFRSVERQRTLIRRKLAAGQLISTILQTMAPPGYSEHHTGRAIDVGCPGNCALDEGFAQTPAFRWLRRHARKFGFVLSYPRRNPQGLMFEPWHWCWRRNTA